MSKKVAPEKKDDSQEKLLSEKLLEREKRRCVCLDRCKGKATRALLCTLGCNLFWIPVFGELFDHIVRRPTHLLTGYERDLRLAREKEEREASCCQPKLCSGVSFEPGVKNVCLDVCLGNKYPTFHGNLLLFCSIKDYYKWILKNIGFPLFRYLFLVS